MIAVSWPLEHDIHQFDAGIGCPARVEQAPDDVEESSREGRGIHGGQAYLRLSTASALGSMAQNRSMGRTVGLVILVGALLIPLAGCAPVNLPSDGEPGPSGSSTESGASATPTPGPPLEPGDIDFRIACTDVVSDQAIYDWGSGNWATDPDFAVPAGSSAATIVEHGGTACGWINLSSNEKLSVAIGQFAPETLGTLRAQRAAAADPVADFGTDGFFAATAGTGQADAFTGPYWISASSTFFLEAGDALQLVQAALAATG